jgi:hypothetical protein
MATVTPRQSCGALDRAASVRVRKSSRRMALHQHDDDTLGVSSTPRLATPNVRLVRRGITKYPGMGVLHIFVRGDTDFRCM